MNEIVPQALQESMNLGKVFVESGMFPDLKSQAQAVVKILAGREYGLSPLQSITELYMVNGKIAMSSKLIAAAIKKSGKYDYSVEESTNEGCKISFYSLDLNEATGDMKRNLLGNIEFTIKDAARAGIVNKEVWKSYPKAMLYARAVSMGGRMFCPDVITAYTPEEVEDTSLVNNIPPIRTVSISAEGTVTSEVAEPDDHPEHPDNV